MKKIILLIVTTLISLYNNAQPQLWGSSSIGGKYNLGTIFRVEGNGNNPVIEHSYYKVEGVDPLYSDVIQATDGKIYGMTELGGTNNTGVLFQYDPITDIYVKKVDFLGVINGSNPQGSLIQAANGLIYGMTYIGGTNNKGVLFEYDPATNILTKKIDFAGATNGEGPSGSLIQLSNGLIYGMTTFGGTSNKGVLFQYDPVTNILTKKVDFNGTLKGAFPYGSLMEASDGNLYGMASEGGANNLGVLFQFNLTTSVFTNKLDFDGATKGSKPFGSLVQASNGKLYGLTSDGGISSNMGVLFQYDISTSTYVKKIDFNGSLKGSNPYGSLMEATDGKLYGMTYDGGVIGHGILFQYDPNTSGFIKKFEFAQTSTIEGAESKGSLMQASDGKLYGITTYQDQLFAYDPILNTPTTKLHKTKNPH